MGFLGGLAKSFAAPFMGANKAVGKIPGVQGMANRVPGMGGMFGQKQQPVMNQQQPMQQAGQMGGSPKPIGPSPMSGSMNQMPQNNMSRFLQQSRMGGSNGMFSGAPWMGGNDRAQPHVMPNNYGGKPQMYKGGSATFNEMGPQQPMSPSPDWMQQMMAGGMQLQNQPQDQMTTRGFGNYGSNGPRVY